MSLSALLFVFASQELVLLAHDGDAFAVAEELSAADDRPTPLVYTSLEERVPRIVPTGRGLGIRLEAHAPCTVREVRAVAVAHPRGWRVVRTAEGLRLVGPPEGPLPGAGGSPWRALPELARLDLAGAEAAMLPAALSAGGLSLVALATETSPPTAGLVRGSGATGDAAPPVPLLPGPLDAWIAPAEAGATLRAVDGGVLDAVFLARTRPLDSGGRLLARRRVVLAPDLGGHGHPWRRAGRGPATRLWSDPGRNLEGQVLEPAGEAFGDGLDLAPRGALEVWFEPPPAAEAGSTWTVLVTVEGTAAEGPRPLGDEPRGPRPAELPGRATAGALVDAGAEHGLGFVHLEGPAEELDIRPTMGPGVAWGDVDGDGWCDLYLVQGAGRRAGDGLSNRLLLNRAGTFVDRTQESGAGDPGAGMGALLFDGDGDGDLDLFVANRGADQLYRNDGRGVFTRVSEEAGLRGDRWSAGVAAADTDLDGDLDLYVTGYLRYDESEMPAPEELASYGREDPIAMLPFAFPGERNTFWRNVGAGGALRFEDATEELGLADELGRGMQPVFWDFDDDGDPDLYVANDVSYNVLFRNEGDGTFKDVSFATGMDDPRGGMGVAVGDVEGDGDEDLFLTNWELEANALYRNNLLSHTSQRSRVATFRDVTVRAGFAPYAVGYTSWGAELGDLDLDGDLDLVVANGYTSPDYESTGICVGQPDLLFLGDGEGRFRERSRELAPDLSAELPSRAVAACDFDRDGDLDLVITANNAPARLFENRFERTGHWLVVRLRDRGANTRAVGARVTVTAGGETWRRTLRAGTSYLVGNPPEVHFGLGRLTAKTVTVRVRWPDGAETVHADQAVDRYLELSR